MVKTAEVVAELEGIARIYVEASQHLDGELRGLRSPFPKDVEEKGLVAIEKARLYQAWKAESKKRPMATWLQGNSSDVDKIQQLEAQITRLREGIQGKVAQVFHAEIRARQEILASLEGGTMSFDDAQKHRNLPIYLLPEVTEFEQQKTLIELDEAINAKIRALEGPELSLLIREREAFLKEGCVGKPPKAFDSGLFDENQELQRKVQALDRDIANEVEKQAKKAQKKAEKRAAEIQQLQGTLKACEDYVRLVERAAVNPVDYESTLRGQLRPNVGALDKGKKDPEKTELVKQIREKNQEIDEKLEALSRRRDEILSGQPSIRVLQAYVQKLESYLSGLERILDVGYKAQLPEKPETMVLELLQGRQWLDLQGRIEQLQCKIEEKERAVEVLPEVPLSDATVEELEKIYMAQLLFLSELSQRMIDNQLEDIDTFIASRPIQPTVPEEVKEDPRVKKELEMNRGVQRGIEDKLSELKEERTKEWQLNRRLEQFKAGLGKTVDSYEEMFGMPVSDELQALKDEVARLAISSDMTIDELESASVYAVKRCVEAIEKKAKQTLSPTQVEAVKEQSNGFWSALQAIWESIFGPSRVFGAEKPVPVEENKTLDISTEFKEKFKEKIVKLREEQEPDKENRGPSNLPT